MEKEELLDESWIKEFENIDKIYEDFYMDNVYYVNINCIYVNKNNNIEKINQERFFMKNPNIISREEIIGIIKRNSLCGGQDNNSSLQSYSLLSIIKYNIILNPEDITLFLKSDDYEMYNRNFLKALRHIDSINFEKTINMFHDLNNLYIIFYEKNNAIHVNNVAINNLNQTKKIYLKQLYKSKYSKTIRKNQ
jgi:hypothetical protein